MAEKPTLLPDALACFSELRSVVDANPSDRTLVVADNYSGAPSCCVCDRRDVNESSQELRDGELIHNSDTLYFLYKYIYICF